MAKDADRDPDALQLLVRANLEIADAPLGDDRADFAGSMEQIESDIAKAQALGTDELIVDVQFSPDVHSTDDILARMEPVQGFVSQS